MAAYKLKYEPAFEGVRGTFIIAVIAAHMFPDLWALGVLAVNVFFVLSGYLITRLLIAELESTNTINLSRFYIRRALRLMPPFWTMLLIFLPLILTGHHRTSQLQSWAMAATYLMNFNVAFGWVSVEAFTHIWSLSAEEQFYWLWPAALLVGARYMPKTMLILLLATAMIWRAYLYLHGASIGRIYFAPDTNSDAILVGCLLGFSKPSAIWVRRAAVTLPLWLLGIAGALMLFTKLPPVPSYMADLAVSSIAGALIVIGAPASLLGKLLSTAPFRFLGKISYGLYLWHLPLIVFFGTRWHLSGWQLLLPVGGAFALATISYFTVEAWSRRVKSQFSGQAIPFLPPVTNA